MRCWSCVVMSKNSRRPSCQRDSGGTDGPHLGATGRVLAVQIALATSGAVHISTPDRLVPDTHAHTHDGQRQVPRDRPDIRAQLTGSFTHVDQRFIRKTTRRDIIHCTRDASRDIKLRCQDHHPAAIAPRPPPSDPQPIRARRRATVAAAPTQPSVIVRYRRPADRRSRPQQWG